MSSFSLKLKHRIVESKSWGQVDEENCPRASLSQDSKLELLTPPWYFSLVPPARLLEGHSVSAFLSSPGFSHLHQDYFHILLGCPFLQASLLYIFLILLPSRLYSSECPVVAHLFLYFFFFCQVFSASIIWLPLSLPFYILDYILLMSFPQQACLTIFCFFPSNSAVTKLFP